MTAPIARWLATPTTPDIERSLSRLSQAAGALHVAAMPDVHLARDVCVGVAFATSHHLYPAAVGGDIGCGMSAIAFDAQADALSNEHQAALALSALYDAVPALKRRHAPPLPAALIDQQLSDPSLETAKRRDGRYQLGTLGRGNHFVELQADDQDQLWLMVHSGSRGMGARIRDHHLRNAQHDPASGLAFLDAGTHAGQAYLADQLWALDYAAANRAVIVEAVTTALDGALGVQTAPDTFLTCHHNHVRHERHDTSDAYVHRKGAIFAGDGVDGVIPGSMGTHSFHTSGRGCVSALCSSSHGAGRAMSRTEARQRITPTALQRDMRGVWFDRRRAHRLRDEAPGAYRDIGAVMRAQRDLTRITRRLRPLLAFKY